MQHAIAVSSQGLNISSPPPPLPQMGIEDIDFFHSTPELEWEGRPTAFDKSQFLPVLPWGKAKSESHAS